MAVHACMQPEMAYGFRKCTLYLRDPVGTRRSVRSHSASRMHVIAYAVRLSCDAQCAEHHSERAVCMPCAWCVRDACVMRACFV
eukprot:6187104-Pleurochrysis_carterae.AAC.1